MVWTILNLLQMRTRETPGGHDPGGQSHVFFRKVPSFSADSAGCACASRSADPPLTAAFSEPAYYSGLHERGSTCYQCGNDGGHR